MEYLCLFKRPKLKMYLNFGGSNIQAILNSLKISDRLNSVESCKIIKQFRSQSCLKKNHNKNPRNSIKFVHLIYACQMYIHQNSIIFSVTSYNDFSFLPILFLSLPIHSFFHANICEWKTRPDDILFTSSSRFFLSLLLFLSYL